MKQQQISTAIKYFRSQFPKQYHQFKQKHQGQKYFQKQLDVINQTIDDYKFISLKPKLADQLLIKLRFIAFNQSYLQNMQPFLLQKFIQVYLTSFKSTFNIQKIYTQQQSTNNQNQDKTLIFQRYSIISQSLIYILKFCFNKQKSINASYNSSHPNTNNNNNKFQNQMLKQSITKNQGLSIKSFVKFILTSIDQVVDNIIRYKIIDIKKIYPQFFSVLCDGFLGFKGGMKCLEMIADLLGKIIEANKDNVWIGDGAGNQNAVKKKRMERLKQIKIDWNHFQNYQKVNQSNQNNTLVNQSQSNKVNQNNQNNKQQNQFGQVCKKRLLLCLQTLLVRYGYTTQSLESNKNYLSSISSLDFQLQQNPSKKTKLRKFITKLHQIIQKKCLQVAYDKQTKNKIKQINIKHMNPNSSQSKDLKILLSLIILSIQFQSQNIMQIDTAANEYKSLFIDQISNKNSHNYFCDIYVLNNIKRKLKEIFLQKFRLILNKNKIISTQKTVILKQLKNIVKYVDLQTFQDNQLKQVYNGLNTVFKPLQKQLNKPFIIIKNSTTTNSNPILQQSIPLIDLSHTSSFINYPITINSLIQSIKFQQKYYILNDIKLFNWFQCQQTNYKHFKSLIGNFHVLIKLKLVDYFVEELMDMQMDETEEIYGLNMSLVKFYKLIAILFYLDAFIGKQSGVLSNKSLKLLRIQEFYNQNTETTAYSTIQSRHQTTLNFQQIIRAIALLDFKNHLFNQYLTFSFSKSQQILSFEEKLFQNVDFLESYFTNVSLNLSTKIVINLPTFRTFRALFCWRCLNAFTINANSQKWGQLIKQQRVQFVIYEEFNTDMQSKTQISIIAGLNIPEQKFHIKILGKLSNFITIQKTEPINNAKVYFINKELVLDILKKIKYLTVKQSSYEDIIKIRAISFKRQIKRINQQRFGCDSFITGRQVEILENKYCSIA